MLSGPYERPVYFTEQKAKIGTIEVSFRPNPDVAVKVAISSTTVQVGKQIVPLLANTHIKVSNISTPNSSEFAVSVRIPTDPVLTIPKTGKTDDTKLKVIACERCSANLSKKKFTRVLPLPSAAWYEMAGDLICHGSHSKITKGFHPRSGDVLVGEQELWVDWGLLDQAAVYTGTTREVEKLASSHLTATLSCHRCRNHIGRVVFTNDKIAWVIIFRHGIKMPAKLSAYHLESYIARELLEASTRHVSFRFILIAKSENGTPFPGLRLWMMGGDLILSSSMTEEVNLALSQVGGKVASGDKAMKLLYTKHVDKCDGMWNDADIISLPLELCLHLYLTLQLSSLTLPPEKRYAQNCSVGYIRYS